MDATEATRLILQTIGLAVTVGGAVYAAMIRPLIADVARLREQVHALEVTDAAEGARDEATRTLLLEIRNDVRGIKTYARRVADKAVEGHKRECRSYAGGTSRRLRESHDPNDRED